MATTPLTLYVPIRQDAASQQAAQEIYKSFATSVHEGLNASQIVHYAHFALVPNADGEDGSQALLLITAFDGPMNPYLSTFWNNDPAIKGAFQAIIDIALTPPPAPVTDLNGFANFVNAHNLNQPADLYSAYPQTVKQILAAFPVAPSAA